ncbi:MAG: GTPase Era [Pseudomonadota bacterium]|nr:GTPase Era [Pseudomonadota bacterium]
MSKTQAGFIAVVGRPNVGKSTLINALVGARVSITTPKPQTTRHRILGIRTEEAVQMIFVDTPGIHVGGKSAMNRMLNQTATDSVRDADCVLWLVQSGRWTGEDAEVLERLRGLKTPVGLIVTKVDLVKMKSELMPFIAELSQRRQTDFVVPISATRGSNLEALLEELRRVLPESPFLYETDRVTDRGVHFRMAEMIREKLFMSLDQELPYAITVEIESDEPMTDGRRHVSAVIWVARDSHKGIVIGKKGARLKQVGSEARRALQADLGQGLHLQLWCRVKRGWADDERALASLGYDLPDAP